LPCVGNDVVDLKDAENLGKSGNSRFLKKILTDAEIEYVKNADNPEAALWSIWACKETAYKVIKKSFPDAAFVPRRWQVVFTKSKSEYSEGEVVALGKDRVYIRLFSNTQYVHCVGAANVKVLDKLIWRVESLPEEKNINPSIYLRHLLRQNLAQCFSLNFNQIKIKRIRQNGELQPPRVYVDDKKTDIDISLSHDGRFVAYTFNDTR
jgi:phosphopantetheine--protein transferase-like protein